MEKRIILAFLLSFAVLYAFRSVYSPAQPASETTTPAEQAAPAAANPSPTPAPQAAPAAPAAPQAASDVQAEKAEDLVVDTPLYVATVSNVGAVLKSYTLKAYSDAAGHPLELVNAASGDKLGWPLALETADTALNSTLAKARYAAKKDGNRIELEFAGAGIHAKKVLQFDPSNYAFSVDASLTKDGKEIPYSAVLPGGFGDQSLMAGLATNALHQTDASFTRLAARSIKDPQTFATQRMGVEDQYFLAMFLFDSPTTTKVEKVDFTGADSKPVDTMRLSAVVPPGKPFQVYIGPKDRTWLGKVDAALPAVVDFGWFEVIARPLLFCLLLIHGYIGNFGWSIIILTLALNLLLFPLRLNQQLSMQKMQKIQPQMRTLQDRYKKLKANDPRRAQVQTEMMGLYKEHGVNPLGGCWPLLLQMPILIGLYRMLAISIELRRAPWLWIDDLSRPELYLIPVLPILMAISMFVMQKMTPTTVDPAQANMMLIMPVMFLFMFWRAQSGLTLYWLTGNLIGIGQQVFINKYWSPHAEAKLQARSRPRK